MNQVKEYLQEIGKKGGQETLARYGKEHFSKIGKGWPKGKARKPRKQKQPQEDPILPIDK